MPPIIETARLALRELTLDDLDFVAAMLDHPEVMRFYPRRYTREEAAAWIQRQLDRYARNGHGLWLVSERASGLPVGQIGLAMHHIDGADEPEVGYLLHRPFWQRGYATEAAAATRDYAFDVLGLPRVISLIRPINLPSQAVARRIGMQPEKQVIHAELDHTVWSQPNRPRHERAYFTPGS